ncbi:hypothetical protein EJ08DRAFT_410895 [Tothia fuscella]|uniref:Uncharacterized protein n=1 Tax=Tothia fuscella TaxID=1048955 RepID=A0A9P4TVP3_9PEZI|nr:hypothetical protein EJ08DRAFT_410895 [Tothia fuscella]
MKGADEKEAQVPLPGNSPHQQRGGRQAREAKAKLALSNLQQDRKATDTTDTSLLLLNSLKAISKDKNADVEVFQQLRELASVDSAYGTNAYTDIIIRDYFRRLSVFTDPDIYLDGPILPARKLFHKYLADLTAQGKSLLPAWWIFSRSVKCHDKFDHVIEQEYPQIGEPVFKAQATNLKQMNPDTEIPKPALPKPQPGQPQNTKPDLGVVPKPPQKKRVRASGEQVSSLDMVNHKKAKLNSKVTDHNGPKSETSKPAKSKQQILKAHEKGLRRAEQRAKKASYAKNDTGKQKVPSKYNISERESNASETWNAEVNADWKSEIDNSFLEKNTL